MNRVTVGLVARWCVVSAVLLVGVASSDGAEVGTLPRRPAAGESGLEQLDGTWKVVSVNTLDVPRPFGRQDYTEHEAEFRKATCRIMAGQLRAVVGEQVRESTLIVDTTKTPSAMDIKGQFFPFYDKSVTTLAIYELKADRLKICFGSGKSPRPLAFRPNDTDGQLTVFVIELERVPQAAR